MNTIHGQDVVRCRLCSNPVEWHCNLCHMDLCLSCTQIHMQNKTKNHEIVEFINRREEHTLPMCNFHNKKRCEMYCKDCNEPTCVLCMISSHQNHEIKEIEEVMKDIKQQVIVDLTELEDIIAPKYNKITCGRLTEDFDNIISNIQDQEDKICKAVHKIGQTLRDKMKEQKRDLEDNNNAMQYMTTEAEKELNEIIHNCRSVLTSVDALAITTYNSRNESFRYRFPEVGPTCPIFSPGMVIEDQIQEMFGEFQGQTSTQSIPKNITGNPICLNLIKSPYGLDFARWEIACTGTEQFWISGNDRKIHQIDKCGNILETVSVKAANDVSSLSINKQLGLLFVVRWPETKVYKYESNRVTTFLNLSDWCPRGLCHTVNDNLLVSMRSLDKRRSRIVRYIGTTETQIMENDNHGKPLFSVGERNVLKLADNRNGDICVSDFAGKNVVVVDVCGDLRFKYKGNITKRTNYKPFQPSHIVTNDIQQILVADLPNDIVHIIDSDGNFIRYIEYPCRGGMSIDTDCNLVVGEEGTGIIRLIKYIE